ncbi:MAG: hypothetical protein K0Q56_827 [Sporolactobacillus laevolacticus]|jgi:hypothetical protein|nr:hypothetical protein [Sporolactobacillus laevolacticus]
MKGDYHVKTKLKEKMAIEEIRDYVFEKFKINVDLKNEKYKDYQKRKFQTWFKDIKPVGHTQYTKTGKTRAGKPAPLYSDKQIEKVIDNQFNFLIKLSNNEAIRHSKSNKYYDNLKDQEYKDRQEWVEQLDQDDYRSYSYKEFTEPYNKLRNESIWLAFQKKELPEKGKEFMEWYEAEERGENTQIFNKQVEKEFKSVKKEIMLEALFRKFCILDDITLHNDIERKLSYESDRPNIEDVENSTLRSMDDLKILKNYYDYIPDFDKSKEESKKN